MRPEPSVADTDQVGTRVAQEHFLVAGAACLNVLSRARSGSTFQHFREGSTSIEIGGTAANIAIDLAVGGTSTALLTALNRSGFASAISTYLQDARIRVFAVRSQKLGDLVNAIQMDEHGHMVGMIASDALALFDLHESMILRSMEEARCVILDTGLSAKTMERIVAKARSLSLPVAVVVSNEMSAPRMLDLVARPDVVFMNRREARRIARMVGSSEHDRVALAAALKSDVVVTLGAESGAELVTNGRPTTVGKGAAPAFAAGNELGAGDALAAHALLLHFGDGLPLDESVRQALKHAHDLLGHNTTNKGEAGSVERSIRGWQHRAMYDQMTGTLNRHAFDTALTKALADCRAIGAPLSMLLIDLDHLKTINDTQGHHAGDMAIMAIAEAITINVDRDNVGRLGGDEFACFISGADAQKARDAALAIAHDLSAASEAVELTASIGVASLLPTDASISAFMKRADEALYQVKRQGRNGVAIHNPSSCTL